MVFGIIASIGSAVISAVSSIGSAVSSFATTFLPRLLPMLDRVGDAIKVIADVVFKTLNIFQPGDDIVDMGDRALQAAEQGIKLHKFDSYDEYLTEIRNFKLDPEKSANLSSAEKIGAGLAVGTAGLEKRFDATPGSFAPIWLLAASNPAYFNADRLVNILQAGHSITDIQRYFEGKLAPSDAVNTRDILMSMERQRSPEKLDATIYAELMATRESMKNLDK